MAEWFKAAVLKTHSGFFQQNLRNPILVIISMRYLQDILRI